MTEGRESTHIIIVKKGSIVLVTEDGRELKTVGEAKVIGLGPNSLLPFSLITKVISP